MSSASWHVGDRDHVNDLMSTLHPMLAIIGGELFIMAGSNGDHSDDSKYILHTPLAIIGGELILGCW